MAMRSAAPSRDLARIASRSHRPILDCRPGSRGACSWAKGSVSRFGFPASICGHAGRVPVVSRRRIAAVLRKRPGVVAGGETSDILNTSGKLGLGAAASFSVLARGCGLCDDRSESDGIVDTAWASREHQQRLTDDPLVKAGVDDVFGELMQVEIINGRASAHDARGRRVVAQSELPGVLRRRGSGQVAGHLLYAMGL